MNDLTVYERITDPIKAIETLGEVLAKSRIFGCESIEQGKVMAWECLARRTPPLQLKETYHLINTSQGAALTMRADAMLAGFLSIGGRHRIIERSGDRAAVELSHAGQTCLFECTYADAKEAGLTDSKKGEKENWSSPRQRMQMLWARVISDGVRAMAPQVCAGKYTPEDFGQRIEAVESAGVVAGNVSDGETVTPYVVESPRQPVATDESRPAATAATEAATVDGFASAEQRAKISSLFDVVGLTADQRAAVLQKRAVNSIRSLTIDQADELIGKLEAMAAKQLACQSKQAPEATTERVDGPASEEQIKQAKELLKMLAQSHPDLYQKVTAKVRAFGKLADMTFGQLRSLLEQLKTKQLESFFAASLTKPTETPADPT
jgi:hypothetical protein